MAAAGTAAAVLLGRRWKCRSRRSLRNAGLRRFRPPPERSPPERPRNPAPPELDRALAPTPRKGPSTLRFKEAQGSHGGPLGQAGPSRLSRIKAARPQPGRPTEWPLPALPLPFEHEGGVCVLAPALSGMMM